MNRRKSENALTALAVVAVMAGCGGGGGSSSPAPAPAPTPPDAGIDRAGVAIGAVTGFGSVVVNGVKYETGSAVITVDDSPGLESELGIGDVVTIVGTIDDSGTTGTAASVSFDDNVEGPVASIDSAANRFIVLGQTINVTATTVFDDSSVNPPSLAGIAVGDVVEVSGFANASGEIEATRIEAKPQGGELEVRGIVSALDSAQMQFALNGLLVDYSGAVLEDFPSGGISDGQPVEAKGTALDASGRLVALRVEFEDSPFAFDDGDSAEIEGFITRFVSLADFDVAGRPVSATAQTVFVNGTAADLVLNAKLEAEGAFDANGVLNAAKIVFKLASSVRVSATVEAIDLTAGELTVLGIRVVTDALTQFEDDSDTQQQRFALADVAVGDFVEIRGFQEAGAQVLRASRLQRDDADSEVELRGFVEAVNAPNLTILGVTVQTGPGTQFENATDMALSAAQFFDSVQAGALVEAQGQYLGGGIIAAEEVEFEND